MRTRAVVIVASLASAQLLACDAISSLFEPKWEVAETNGDNGAFHFVTNPYDLRVGQPEHIRVERIEKRTIKKPGGATEEETRERKVRVVMASCESKSICDAVPHATDTREVVVTTKTIGSTKVLVTVAIDETDLVKDSLTIRSSF